MKTTKYLLTFGTWGLYTIAIALGTILAIGGTDILLERGYFIHGLVAGMLIPVVGYALFYSLTAVLGMLWNSRPRE